MGSDRDEDELTGQGWLLGLGFGLLAWLVVFLVLWHFIPCVGG
jgi:hypothetical protein